MYLFVLYSKHLLYIYMYKLCILICILIIRLYISQNYILHTNFSTNIANIKMIM